MRVPSLLSEGRGVMSGLVSGMWCGVMGAVSGLVGRWRLVGAGLVVWLLVVTGVSFVSPPRAEAEAVPGVGVSRSLAAIRGLDGSGGFGSGGFGSVALPSGGSSLFQVEDEVEGTSDVSGEEGLDEIQLDALDRVKEKAFQDVKRPGFDVWPGFDQVQVVGLDSWFRVDDESWADVPASEKFANEEFVAKGSPVRVEYEFSDGVRSCDRQGLAWVEGADPSEACFRGWEHTSAVEPQQVRARLVFEFEWDLTVSENEKAEDNGVVGSGSFVTTGNWSDVRGLTVGEVGTVVSDGTPPVQVVRDRGDAMASAQGVEEKGCGWSLTCHTGRAATGLWDLATKAWDSLSSGVLAAAKILWDVLGGCLSNLTDAVGMVKGLLETAVDLYTDPAGFVQGQVDLVAGMFEAAKEDPEAFALEMGKEAIDYDMLVNDSAKWVGKYGCEIALGVLTGGSTVIAQRFGTVAKFMLKLDKFMEKMKLDKFPGRKKRDDDDREGDPDDSDAPVVCRNPNSFPAGTPVRTSTGLTPIEQIEPGDVVLAADPGSGVWSYETVLDQWSATDDGQLVTAVLVDGSEVTATDHHLFWVASDGAWVELEDVQPGDTLLTPDGVTTVDHVVVSSEAVRTVWELDTAGPDTFTVHTGTADVLVHNQDEFSPGTFVESDGVRIRIYSNDHPPPHAHVVIDGKTVTRIGQNGKPLDGDPPLTGKAKRVVEDNLSKIRSQIGAYMKWYRENCG